MVDATDRSILSILKENARAPLSEIAEEIGVSEGTVRNRIARLVSEGTVRRFTYEGSYEGVSAIIGLKTDSHKPTGKIVEKLKHYAGVEELLEVTGRFDVICLVHSPALPILNELLEKIRRTEGVMETESFTVLKKS
ncbi:Lrp/AsnC family transcriptional regulator [Candidatus Micrarchaeota archaeon]|nr:Lrp/AsnC family transcriptional regulator [Candidatus Micrarchaeota archaeon]